MTDQPNDAGQPADLPASLAQSNQPVTAAHSGPGPGSVMYVDGDPTAIGVGLAGQAVSDPAAGAEVVTFATDPELAAWRDQLIEDILARLAPAAPAPAAAAPIAPAAAPVPSIGRIVVVRAPHHRDAPGIVTEVSSATMISVQVFRGDHLPHAFQSLPQIDPANTTGQGWFWPERK